MLLYTSERMLASPVSTPDQLTASANDYAFAATPALPGGNDELTFQRLSSDASRTITGIAAKGHAFVYVLANVGSFDIVLADQSSSSAAANRIVTGTAASLTISAAASVTLVYDVTSARWRVVSGVSVGAVAGAFPLLAPDSTASTPNYAFSTAPTAGFGRIAGDTNYVEGGLRVIKFGSAGEVLVRSGGAFSFAAGNEVSAAADLSLFRDAADSLAQRRGTNPQAFRIYNTFTDASNYERGSLGWASNILVLAPTAAGSGTQRALQICSAAAQPLGFYGHAAIAQQTGVAVTAGGIHAALVALGLFTA